MKLKWFQIITSIYEITVILNTVLYTVRLIELLAVTLYCICIFLICLRWLQNVYGIKTKYFLIS